MEAIRLLGRATFASLAVRNYRLYFIGQAISLSGTWMQTVALGWLALQITGSGSQLGLITAAQFLPLMFLGPWGGVVADRFDRRYLLYVTQIISALVATAIAVIVYAGLMQPWMLYMFALAVGCVRVFDQPTRHVFVSEMVGVEHLKNAISLNATINNMSRAIGPLVGGIFIATTGLAFCFMFNALSFFGSIGALAMMREGELHHHAKEAEGDGKMPAQLLDGFRYVLSTRPILHVLVIAVIIGTLTYEFTISLALLAQQTFGGGAGEYAALMAAFGAGAVLGGLIAAARHTIAPHQLTLMLFAFGLSIIATGFAPTFTVAIIGTLVIGALSVNVLSAAQTMVQLGSVPHMRGRVMALWSMAIMGTTPIGGPVIGWIGEHIGARAALETGGIAAIVAGCYGLFILMRRDAVVPIPESVQLGAEEATSDIFKA